MSDCKDCGFGILCRKCLEAENVRLKTQVDESNKEGFLRGLDFSIQVLKDEASRIREKALRCKGGK